MDVFAHTLWTNALFHLKYHDARKWRYLAAFFGVAPDLVGFTPVFIYLVLSGNIFNPKTIPLIHSTHWTVGFAEQAYNYTHSAVIFLASFIIVCAIGTAYNRRQFKQKESALQTAGSAVSLPKPGIWIFWPMLGWILHILIDFFTHPDFYRTPILFPLSNYRNSHGISWANETFMIVNYGLIAVVYFGLWYYQRVKHNAVTLSDPSTGGEKS